MVVLSCLTADLTFDQTLDNLATFPSDIRAVKQPGFPAPDSISGTLYLPDLRIIAELLPEPAQSKSLADEALRLKPTSSLADNKSKVTRELVRAFVKKLVSMNKASYLHSPFRREVATSHNRCSRYSSRRCLGTIWRSI